MKVREVMTTPVVRIRPEETVEVAARTLAHYNIGAMPVCGSDGKVCGMVTDRDLVTRCLASGRLPSNTQVKEVMSGTVISVRPDTDAGIAASMMGARQVRRLPVMENGKLCGMVSLGDLTNAPADVAGALSDICANISPR